MTDIQILEKSIKTLSAINVPVGQLATIGFPIYQVVADLTSLLEAVNNLPDKKEDEPRVSDVEFVPEETAE